MYLKPSFISLDGFEESQHEIDEYEIHNDGAYLLPQSVRFLNTPKDFQPNLSTFDGYYQYFVKNNYVVTDKNVFDSHAHLDRCFQKSGCSFKLYRKNNSNLYNDKFEGCISVVCHPKDFNEDSRSHRFLEDELVYGIYGCHPRFAHLYDPIAEANLIKCLKQDKVLAIGEIGLDQIHKVSYSKQVETFKRQLNLALELCLPICLHVRDDKKNPKANIKAFEIIKEMIPNVWPMHLHCFTDDYQTAKMWLNEFPKMKIGLTPNSFAIEVAKYVPLERILLETDSPYFIPKIIKNKQIPSTPINVIHTAAQLGEIKKIPVPQVLAVCRDNLKRVYGI